MTWVDLDRHVEGHEFFVRRPTRSTRHGLSRHRDQDSLGFVHELDQLGVAGVEGLGKDVRMLVGVCGQ